MKRIALLLTVVWLTVVLFVAAGCTSTGGFGAPSAATVNGTEIAMSALYEDLDVLANSTSYASQAQQQGIEIFGPDGTTYTTDFVAGWLTVLVRNTLIEQQLESLGGEVTPADRSQATESYAQLSASGEVPEAFVDRLIESEATTVALQRALQETAPVEPVSEEEIRAYYDANIDATMQQAGGDVVCATHATVTFGASEGTAAEPTAEQDAAALQQINGVAAQVAAGEDFTAVSESLAQDPSGAASGGDFGCFVRGSGQVPTTFEDAAFTQPVGEVGPVVRSDLGYHIVLVRSRGVLPFEEARARILEQLQSERTDTGQAQADEFLRQSSVQIDPRFGTFDVEAASVVPPEGPTSPTSIDLLDPLTGEPTEPTEPTGTP